MRTVSLTLPKSVVNNLNHSKNSFLPLRSILRFPLGVLLSVCWLTACIPAQPPVTALVPPLSVRTLGTITSGSPLAWAENGKQLAVNDSGLTIIDADSGTRQRLNHESTLTALAWAPDAEAVVFATPAKQGTLLRVVDLNGRQLAKTEIKGNCRQFFWRQDGRILASYELMTDYSFGTSFQAGYVEWRDLSATVVVPLVDTTLSPFHMQAIDKNSSLFFFDLSPWGDEIVYSKINAPPMFPAYFQLVHLPLGIPRNTIIAGRLSTANSGRFISQGEDVLYGDGQGSILRQSVWNETPELAYRSAGRSIALSAGEKWLVIDDVLYRDKIPFARFSAQIIPRFSPVGGRVALVAGKQLFVIDGLVEELPATVSSEAESKIRVLRSWRGKGLISPEEYRQRKLQLEK